MMLFFFSSRRRHTRWPRDWSSDVCSSDLILIRDHVLVQISSGTLSRPVGWIVMVVLVAIWAVVMWRRDARRRSSSLPAPPLALTITKIVVAFAGGAGLILLANADRGIRAPVYGLPWVVLVVLAVLLVWSFLLGRCRFGVYVYAVGGNAEAARRAGINLARIRRSEEHTSELQSRGHLVCRLLLEKKKLRTSN